jgi:hypothetical protein
LRSVSDVFNDSYTNAKVAQLVEHDLAKVGVASSNLVFRSTEKPSNWKAFFMLCYSRRSRFNNAALYNPIGLSLFNDSGFAYTVIVLSSFDEAEFLYNASVLSSFNDTYFLYNTMVLSSF